MILYDVCEHFQSQWRCSVQGLCTFTFSILHILHSISPRQERKKQSAAQLQLLPRVIQ